MRFFLDTEFIEGNKSLDLISLALVSQDGREYYAINKDCCFSNASDWVRENVLSPMEIQIVGNVCLSAPLDQNWKSPNEIALDLLQFIKTPTTIEAGSLDPMTAYALELDPKPEFWGYYADYDWVLFCWLFGKMINLPVGFPKYCRDLKQECAPRSGSLRDRLGNPQLPPQDSVEHNALNDARWIKQAWEFLQDYQQTVDAA